MPMLMARLLDAPDEGTPSGIRDRALLGVFAYLAVRVDELHHMKVGNIVRDGEHTVILRIKGKGNELRRGVIPPVASAAVNRWIEKAGIEKDKSGPLFRPANSPRGNGVDGLKRNPKTVKKYCAEFGIDESVSVDSLCATVTTEAD